MTTCSTSLMLPVLLWAGIASAFRILGGNAARVAAAIPVWPVLWRNLRREVVIAVFQQTLWWALVGTPPGRRAVPRTSRCTWRMFSDRHDNGVYVALLTLL